jgi:alpha-galactosidase
VLNQGSIDNLNNGCVEVACKVDAAGIHAQRFGPLPEQLAALNRAHMAVHELVVDALLHRDKQKAKYALMIDPLTAAVCSLEEIDRLFEEMWAAERESLRLSLAKRPGRRPPRCGSPPARRRRRGRR